MSNTPGLRKRSPEELAEMRRISELQNQVRTATHLTCERITPERRASILRAVSEADDQVVASLQAPLEVHLFASNWNSDGGVSPLLQVVQHPFCDAGTALWLYWDNDPYFYAQFHNIDDADD